MKQMILGRNSLWGRLTEPHSAVTDPDRRARARLLASFMLGLTILSGLLNIVYFLAFSTLVTEGWLGGSLFFLVYLLSRSPKPYLGEYAVVSGITGIITFILISQDIDGKTHYWFLMPILMAAVLLPMWAAITFTLLNFSILIAIELTSPQLDSSFFFALLIFLIFTSIIALATKYAREQDQEKLEQQALALAKSSANYRQLFDDVPVGLFETTPNGEILQANQALLQILRFPDQQALQTVAAADLYVNSTEREHWLGTMEEQESLEDYEVQLIRSDQEKIWVREQVRAIRNETGEISHFRGSMEDVTQRRWLQKQVAEQNNKLQMILSAMPNVLLVVDEQNRLTSLYSPFDFPLHLEQRWAMNRKKLAEVLPVELAAQIQSAIETVREELTGCSFEQAVQRKDEEQSSYLRVKLSPVADTGNILIVVDDLTKLKEAEEKVRAYAAELESSNADLDAFSHTVAHDLRRPLNHIMGYADLIKEFSKDELSSESTQFLARIEEAVLNMSQMIQSLLMLAQLREANEVVELVEMSSLIEDALRRTQPDVEKRGVHVEVQQPIPNALGYRPWLEEVFANLINNAVQYIGHENTAPTITLRAVTLDDCARYEVVDNGLGVSLENQPHLFDMLTRFHESESSGTGLGLSIVHRIITKLGGIVGLESEPDHGSTFWFTLPLPPGRAGLKPN